MNKGVEKTVGAKEVQLVILVSHLKHVSLLGSNASQLALSFEFEI